MRTFSASTSPFVFVRVAACLVLALGQSCANPEDGEQDTETDTSARQDDSEDDNNSESGGGKETTDEDPDNNSDSSQGGAKEKLFEYKSGDRLTPYFLNAADGASQFYGWYDEKLKTPCSFQMLSSSTLPYAEDAKVRCMPPMVQTAQGNFYADDKCENSADIAIIGQCSDPASIKYAQISARSCGEGQLKVREVLQIRALTSEDKLWYRQGGFSPCVERSTTEIKYAAMELGEEVELDSFVSASPSK